MNSIRILLGISSATSAFFFILLALGTLSAPAFVVSAIAWIVLLTFKAYTPRTIGWQPLVRANCLKARCELPLAA